MSDHKKQPPTYEVGYCKPPQGTRFQKGRSGNPSGRPKGKLNINKPLMYELSKETFKDTFMEEAYRMVRINAGAGEQNIPIARAVIRALGVKAAKGHLSAQKLFTQTLLTLESENRTKSEGSMHDIIKYKETWTQELNRRAALGLPIDAPVPHPDDIFCDMSRGTVVVNGPLSQEDKDEQDYYKEVLKNWKKTKAQHEDTLSQPIEGEGEGQDRDFIESEIKQCVKVIAMLEELSGADETLGLYEANKIAKRIE